MRCDEFEARLNDLLDLRLDPAADAPLATHGQQCLACRRLLISYGELLLGLEALPAPALPAEFSERAVEGWLAEPVSPSRRRYLPHLVATSAALLIALYLGGRGGPTDSPRRVSKLPAPRGSSHQTLATAIAASDGASPRTQRETRVARPERSDGPERRQYALHADSDAISDTTAVDEPFSERAHNPGGLLADVAALWPGTYRTTSATEPRLTELHRTVAIAEVASGLKPLTDSAAGAVQFLLNVLPPSSASAALPLGAPSAPPSAKSPNEAS